MPWINRILSRHRLAALLATLAVIAFVTAVAPLEKTLGANVRLVYLHGAWVWAGMVAFALAGLAGLADLLLRGVGAGRRDWAGASLALGRTGLVFWLTYLPLSLYVQQVNWGGIFWDEPRWKIALAFGVAGILLQAAILLFGRSRLSSLVNLAFGAALWIALSNVQNVLHPVSPIFGPGGSVRIAVFFVLLVVLGMGCMLQLALFFKSIAPPAQKGV